MNPLNQHERTFKALFKEHFKSLCYLAYGYVEDWDLSREVVQGAFIQMWERRASWTDDMQYKAYLSRSVRNAAIDYQRKKKSHHKYEEHQKHIAEGSEEMRIGDHRERVTLKLAAAIQQLKPKMREIFRLYHDEGLTYQEIADHMGISKRTVEDNMARAYGVLRNELSTDKEFMDSYLQVITWLLIVQQGIT